MGLVLWGVVAACRPNDAVSHRRGNPNVALRSGRQRRGHRPQHWVRCHLCVQMISNFKDLHWPPPPCPRPLTEMTDPPACDRHRARGPRPRRCRVERPRAHTTRDGVPAQQQASEQASRGRALCPCTAGRVRHGGRGRGHAGCAGAGVRGEGRGQRAELEEGAASQEAAARSQWRQ